jgi:TM2 domain-containing membrane protein YozV
MMGGYGPPPQMIYIREKSTGVAAVLSIVWAGLGQVYVGKIGRGLALMIAYFFAVFIGLFSFITGGLLGGVAGAVGGIVLVGVLYFSLWIWNVFDAYNLANEYNDSMRNSGRRPW